ncbi:conserved hypothetical protein [Gammaproteobacteria bacterium]
MKKELYYLVSYSTGQYEDHYTVNVFVTNDENKAKKWIEKFNRILKSFIENNNPFDNDSDELENIPYEKINRWYYISEINNAFYNIIELR